MKYFAGWILRLASLLGLRGLRRLGWICGDILVWSGSRIAHTVSTNLRICYPQMSEVDRRVLARDCLRHTSCVYFESAALWYWSDHRVAQLRVQTDGEQTLIEMLKSSPVIAVVPHFGNWEFLTEIVGRFGGISLYDDRRTGPLEEQLKSARSRFGMEIVPGNRSGIRRVVQRSRAGTLICILPDQVPTRGTGVTSMFMGHRALTTTLVHQLARRYRARVVALSAKRVADGFHVRVQLADEEIYSEDIDVSVRAMNELVEQVVSRDPAQYQWGYKRFRRLGGPDPYRRH